METPIHFFELTFTAFSILLGAFLALVICALISSYRKLYRKDLGLLPVRRMRVLPRVASDVIEVPYYWPKVLVKVWASHYWNKEISKIAGIPILKELSKEVSLTKANPVVQSCYNCKNPTPIYRFAGVILDGQMALICPRCASSEARRIEVPYAPRTDQGAIQPSTDRDTW